MADNYGILEPSSPSKTFGSDQIGGVDYPRTKAIFGPDGTNEGDVAKNNGMPVGPARASAVEAMITKAYTFFTNTYQNLTLTNVATCRILTVTNWTDALLSLSFDGGTTAHAIIPPNGQRSLPIADSATAVWGRWEVAAPSVGNAYFEVQR